MAGAREENTLKVRMDTVTLDLMEKARGYLKLDKSKFVRQSIRQMAMSIIEEQEKTRFTREDWRLFFQMLEEPSEPTERMKRAAKKYREIIDNNGI